MFDVCLPDFFQNSEINDYFKDELNEFIQMKTNEFFNSESLTEFVDMAEEMEDLTLSFVNAELAKKEVFQNKVKKYEDNNDKLRELNSQVAAFKISDLGFGFMDQEKHETNVRTELADLIAKK